MAIADLRREYELNGLRRRDLLADPLAQFQNWFNDVVKLRADRSSPMEVNAMTLTTVDRQGRPSARVVLLKGIDERGFIFFTNYQSRKGVELAGNPNSALVFYWPDMERQVCVAGTVKKISREESEVYFKSRPRGSQLAACASRQGEPVEDRAALENRWRELDAEYSGKEIPMPTYWGGYVLSPERIEFWQGRSSRLHDRFCYSKQRASGWRLERLCP
jgi:pyridoxamine 5'-phosphate oxidase